MLWRIVCGVWGVPMRVARDWLRWAGQSRDPFVDRDGGTLVAHPRPWSSSSLLDRWMEGERSAERAATASLSSSSAAGATGIGAGAGSVCEQWGVGHAQRRWWKGVERAQTVAGCQSS